MAAKPVTAFRPRLRLAPVTPDENELHEAVARYLEIMVLLPAVFTCFPAGIVPLPRAAAAKLYRFGMRRGMPDFIGWHDGRSFGLELKTATGILSKTVITRSARGAPIVRVGQEETFALLRQAGVTIRLCRSLPDVIGALNEWGIPLRSGR